MAETNRSCHKDLGNWKSWWFWKTFTVLDAETVCYDPTSKPGCYDGYWSPQNRTVAWTCLLCVTEPDVQISIVFPCCSNIVDQLVLWDCRFRDMQDHCIYHKVLGCRVSIAISWDLALPLPFPLRCPWASRGIFIKKQHFLKNTSSSTAKPRDASRPRISGPFSISTTASQSNSSKADLLLTCPSLEVYKASPQHAIVGYHSKSWRTTYQNGWKSPMSIHSKKWLASGYQETSLPFCCVLNVFQLGRVAKPPSIS